MSNRLKTGSFDLQAVVILSTIFFLLIIFLPNLTVPRIILGLPYLLFFPGYALISLLYPTKKETEKTEDAEKEKEKESAKSRRIDFRSRQRKKEEKPEEKKEETRKVRTITLPMRISLAFALSLAVSPLLGFVLDQLYLVNDSIFGLDTIPVVVILYVFIVPISILAVIRRERYPKEQRFQMNIRYRNPLGDAKEDQAITLVLVLLIIASSITGLYLYKNFHGNDRFTEFYILNEKQEIGDYPDMFYNDTQQSLFFGVRNNEFRNMNYSIQVGLLWSIPETYENMTSNITLTHDIQYVRELKLDHNEEYRSILNFTIPESGSHNIIFNLAIDGEIYRTLNLLVRAFDRSDMLYALNGTITAFITGSDGLVSTVEDLVSSYDNYSFIMNIINDRGHSVGSNTTVRISDYPTVWTDHYQNGNLSYVNDNHGIYIHRRIDEDSQISNMFSFRLPKGTWRLIILVENPTWTINFNRTVEVY